MQIRLGRRIRGSGDPVVGLSVDSKTDDFLVGAVGVHLGVAERFEGSEIEVYNLLVLRGRNGDTEVVDSHLECLRMVVDLSDMVLVLSEV
jgi:hypothetical protein